MPWSRVLESAAERDGEPAPPWCPLPERLTLLTRPSAAGYAADGEAGRASGSSRAGTRSTGWRRRPRASWLTRSARTRAPLAALGELPAVGLHGDLKLANVALLPRGPGRRSSTGR